MVQSTPADTPSMPAIDSAMKSSDMKANEYVTNTA